MLNPLLLTLPSPQQQLDSDVWLLCETPTSAVVPQEPELVAESLSSNDQL